MKKFGLKAIVAAIGMTAGVAMASPGTDLILEVTDGTTTSGAQTTFIDDLGVAALNPSGTITLGSAFDTWLAGQTSGDSFSFGTLGSNGAVGDLTIDPNNMNGGTPGLTGAFSSIFAASGSTLASIVGSVGTSVAFGTTPSFQTVFQAGNIYNEVTPNAYGTAGTVIDLYTYNTSGVATLYGTANLVMTGIGTTGAAATLTITPLVSSVPEPGTYALMAAGLLAVGAIVRRRSRA